MFLLGVAPFLYILNQLRVTGTVCTADNYPHIAVNEFLNSQIWKGK